MIAEISQDMCEKTATGYVVRCPLKCRYGKKCFVAKFGRWPDGRLEVVYKCEPDKREFKFAVIGGHSGGLSAQASVSRGQI